MKVNTGLLINIAIILFGILILIWSVLRINNTLYLESIADRNTLIQTEKIQSRIEDNQLSASCESIDNEVTVINKDDSINTEITVEEIKTMPIEKIDGIEYIGMVEIPSLNISLSILNETSERNLELSPTRYSGSVYTDDLIIAGHSYKNHFRYIKKLTGGDEVVVIDCDGNRFTYVVKYVETVGGYEVDKMMEGDWDLTLFTCTNSGSDRLAVRCIYKVI